MRENSTRSVWALLCVVVVLFVLSIVAPRQWRSVALVSVSELRSDQTAETDIALARATASGTYNAEPPMPQRESSLAADRRVHAPVELPVGIQLLSPLDVQPLIVQDADDAEANVEPHTNIPKLEDFAMNGRVVDIGPQVAKPYEAPNELSAVVPPRIGVEFDPSSLPSSGFVRLTQQTGAPRSTDRAPTVMRRTPETTADIATNWPLAAAVSSRIEALSERDECAAWCSRVVEQLKELASVDSLDADRIAPIIDRLHGLSDDAVEMAAASSDDVLRGELARVGYAISRRLAIWEQVSQIASAEAIRASYSLGDSQHRRQVIDSLATALKRTRYNGKWRNYLLVDEARERLCQGETLETAECRELAKRVLLRTEYAILTPDQRAFLNQPEIADYMAELRHLASEPVDYLRLLDELERYEGDLTPEHAVHVAAAQQICRWSDVEEIAELGQRLNAHYRNANVRVAVSDQLVNRLVPKGQSSEEVIDDVILGVPTAGFGEMSAQAKVRLLSSDRSWRFLLEVEGGVESQTFSDGGPAVFYSSGQSVFRAHKQVTVHPYGIYDHAAQTVADTSSTLTGMETRLDGVPLLGDIAQSVALRRYRESAPAAQWETEGRIESRVNRAVDEQVGAQLDKMLRRFAIHFYGPAQRLALNPVAVEMRTTEQYMVARYRLAGHHQLAAHTPRPLAPADSWLSVQLHESAFNNVIDQFGWEGKRARPADLHRQVTELFKLGDPKLPEDMPDNVIIQFADEDPLRVSFHEGRMSLTLALAELRRGRKRWRNFVVRIHYRPAPEQADADLVRDQYVELIGRLGLRDQVALRGVFSRVFTRSKPIRVISSRLKEDPRLEGLALTQLAVGHGWMGVALGTN